MVARFIGGLTIYIKDPVFDEDSVAGDAHATFDVVFFEAGDVYGAELGTIRHDVVCRVVEDDNVISLDRLEAGQALVGEHNPIQIGGNRSEGNAIVNKGDGERHHRQARAVVELTYKYKVPGHEGAFHGAGGDEKSFYHEGSQEKDDG
jgi:hypothetical protein